LDEQLCLFWHETRTTAARPLLGRFRNQNQRRWTSLREVFHRAPNKNTHWRKPEKCKRKQAKDVSSAVPFTTYLAYKQQRPSEMMDDNSPFYLAINTQLPKAGKKWFRR